MDFEGKIVAITGGNSGIGNACARLVAERGGRVIIGDINAAPFESVLAALPHQELKHGAFKLDVASAASNDEFFSQLTAFTDGQVPHALINCAGILPNLEGLGAVDEALYDKIMNVNMRGTYLINKKFVFAMKAAKVRGSVVNFTSRAITGQGQCPVYAAAKAGVLSFTTSLAKDFGADGIRCNCVSPGFLDTALFDNAFETMGADENTQKARIKFVRAGSSKEGAEVACFLASDKASFVNGSVYHVDGGVNCLPPSRPLLCQ